MFHRPPSKSERKSFIPPISSKQCGLRDITNNIVTVKAAQPIQQKKKKIDKIPPIDNGRANQLNNIIKNSVPNKKQNQRYDRQNRQQVSLKEDIHIINRKYSFQKPQQYYQKSRSINQRIDTQNSKALADHADLIQIEKENSSLSKPNFNQKIKQKNRNQTTQKDFIAQQSQKLFKVRKTSVIGVKESFNDGHIQRRGKVQSGFIKYTSDSQKSLSFQERCQITAQVYRNSQNRMKKVSSQRKKCLIQESSPLVKVLKNEMQNEPTISPSQFHINSNKCQRGESLNVSKRPKPIDTSKSDNSKIIDNKIANTVAQRNFIIKSKSKAQVNNKNHAFLETEDQEITENQGLNYVNSKAKQINAFKEENTQPRKRSTTTSSGNIQGSSKQLIYCRHLREKSDHTAHKEAQNIQFQKKIEFNNKNVITVSRKDIEEIVYKTQQKERQRILKQIETTQSIKCIMEEVQNNRKLKSSMLNTEKAANANSKPNLDKKSDSQAKSQISIVLEQHNKDIYKTQRQSAKEEYIDKGFPKKKRRNYIGGCKIRRIEWGKSKQKERLSDRILADIPINIQDFYTPPLDQNQIKKEIQSEFRKQSVKINTINLFQQIVVNGQMMGLSLIAHDQSDQTPLQSLQELYKQL